MAALHRVLLHRVQHPERRHDLAAGEDPNLKLAVGDFSHPFGQHFGAAINGVQALGKA